MRSRLLVVALVVSGLFALWPVPAGPLHAQPADAAALTGLVAAADEGPLEGVLVSAKKTNSTVTPTAVTDAAGRYRFPRSRIEPGQYALRIKATGYDLDAAATATVTAAKTATVDLKLSGAVDHFFWSFTVNNLFDRLYYDYAVASSFIPLKYATYPLPGRNYLLKAGVTF